MVGPGDFNSPLGQQFFDDVAGGHLNGSNHDSDAVKGSELACVGDVI